MGDQDEEKFKRGRGVSMMVPKGLSGNAMMSSKSVAGFGGMKSMSRMRMRRMSYGFGGIAGIKGLDRTSQVAIEFKRPPLVYLSTYQLDPHPHLAFHVARVTKMVDCVLDKMWLGHKYGISESPALALRIAGETMRKVKYMSFNRFRVISVVTISEKRAQSYNNAITFLWDHERDRYVDVQRENTTNFIQVTIFGIYLD